MNSIKVQYSMDTILMNSENSKASDPYKLLLDYSEKNNLTEKSQMCCFIESQHKIAIKNTKTIDLKCQLQRGMINLNYLTDRILYQIFKTILNKSSKNMRP